ncbi:MAG: hypothetical protein M3Q81_03720 [bacterium]|nr:hypothetical protein [bacterium]
MKNWRLTISSIVLALALVVTQAGLSYAQIETVDLSSDSASLSASMSGDATASAQTTTVLPEIKPDITTPTVEQKDKYVAFLEANPVGPLSWHNVLQHAIRQSVSDGLSANIVILLLLFPVIASFIAASRHLIGLQGFGIYIPAVLSVAFVSTGIMTGIILFILVVLSATIFRTLIKFLKLQYLPRTALLLWGVSLSVLLILLLTSIFGFSSLLTVTIFPLLIIILLTENFIETQLASSQSQAVQLTVETLLIAVLCSLFISSETIQRTVLLRPELTIVAVAAFNLAVGKYSGLRLLEYIRFRSLLED